MLLEPQDFDLPAPPLGDMAALRVKAARDVLERLDHEYDATQSGYVDFRNGTVCAVCAIGGLFYALLRSDLLGNRHRYEMVGGQPLAPGLTLSTFFDELRSSNTSPGFDFLRNVLTLAFPLEQLSLIEAAFMQQFDGYFAGIDFNTKDKQRFFIRELFAYKSEAEVSEMIGPEAAALIGRVGEALNFRDELRDPEDRLRAIMQNIVDNQGEFRP